MNKEIVWIIAYIFMVLVSGALVLTFLPGVIALICSLILGIITAAVLTKYKIKAENRKIERNAKQKILEGEYTFRNDGKEVNMKEILEKSVDPNVAKDLSRKIEKRIKEDKGKEGKKWD